MLPHKDKEKGKNLTQLLLSYFYYVNLGKERLPGEYAKQLCSASKAISITFTGATIADHLDQLTWISWPQAACKRLGQIQLHSLNEQLCLCVGETRAAARLYEWRRKLGVCPLAWQESAAQLPSSRLLTVYPTMYNSFLLHYIPHSWVQKACHAFVISQRSATLLTLLKWGKAQAIINAVLFNKEELHNKHESVYWTICSTILLPIWHFVGEVWLVHK